MPPLRDQPDSGTEDTFEGRLSTPEFVTELDALISELEAAKEGSQALDIRIHHGFRILGGHSEDMASLLIKEGVSWPTVRAALDEIVPPYSTSLDAALQGEEIVFAIRSAKGHRWGAMQRTSWGGEELAWATTEPLARRLAALKSRRTELQKSLEVDETIEGRTTTPQPEAHLTDEPAAEEAQAADGEEEITGLPHRDVTQLHDNQEDARRDEQEAAQHDESQQSNQKEKDWEILF